MPPIEVFGAVSSVASPEKSLNSTWPHAEARAVGVGRHRVARHRLGADAEHDVRLAERDVVGGGEDGVEAGAAQALHQQAGTSGFTPEYSPMWRGR